MKAFLLTATVLLSLNSFAQEVVQGAAQETPAPAQADYELTREEKQVAFKAIGSFMPKGSFKGSKLNSIKRCVGGVYAGENQISASVYENKFFPLTFDYHPNSIGIAFITVDDKVTQATLTDKYVSITAVDRKDGSTEKLEIQKLEKNKVIMKVTYSNKYHPHLEGGCKLDLDKEFKGN